jgi:hypothetical protein
MLAAHCAANCDLLATSLALKCQISVLRLTAALGRLGAVKSVEACYLLPARTAVAPPGQAGEATTGAGVVSQADPPVGLMPVIGTALESVVNDADHALVASSSVMTVIMLDPKITRFRLGRRAFCTLRSASSAFVARALSRNRSAMLCIDERAMLLVSNVTPEYAPGLKSSAPTETPE